MKFYGFLWLCLSWVSTCFPSTAEVDEVARHPGMPPNTNHIFNAIHSSMRQWGSSLNHNGMSMFIADVPSGVKLYHGSASNKPVTGMEWLAFEPEHAVLFASRPQNRVPPNHPPPEPPGDQNTKYLLTQSVSHTASTLSSRVKRAPLLGPSRNRDPMEDEAGPFGGWLHTYMTKRSLRLLYVDGMSAGKTHNGTIDTQDYLLLNETEDHPGFWDYERAGKLCSMAQWKWDNRIDGILRMEAGFEIIMCAFENTLDAVRITRAKSVYRGTGDIQSVLFAYIRAISTRYQGIGGNRVTLNYDDFVTAYSYPLNLFNAGDLPRLKGLPEKDLIGIRENIDKMVWHSALAKNAINWQSIADMIVQRYSDSLKYLTTGNLSLEDIQTEAASLLRPFHDFEFPNATAEIDRCTTQFLPPQPGSSLASQAVTNIANLICSTLHSVETEKDHSTIVAKLDALVKYLNWTTWRQCGHCEGDEICFVAMWPYGTVEDHYNPSCVNATNILGRRGYWGWP